MMIMAKKQNGTQKYNIFSAVFFTWNEYEEYMDF